MFLPDLQVVSRFAVNRLLGQARFVLGSLSPSQGIDEHRLQFGIKEYVQGHIAQVFDLHQLVFVAQDLGQDRDGFLARNGAHGVAVSVAQEAAIAPVHLFVFSACAGLQAFQSKPQYREEHARTHELLEVARAAGDGVVEDQKLLAKRGVGQRFGVFGDAQMVDAALELFLQAKMERGDERMQVIIGSHSAYDRQQDLDGFGVEFPVEIDAFLSVLRITGIAGRAITGMLDLSLSVLDLSAMHADPETESGALFARHGEVFSIVTVRTEIDVPKARLAQEFVSKHRVVRIQPVGFPEVLRLIVDQHLAYMEDRVALIRVVGDAAGVVRRGGENLSQSQHAPFATFVRPHGRSATRARRRSGFAAEFGVGATVAQSPDFHLRELEIHLIDGDFPLAGVECASRSQVVQRTGRCTLVLERKCFVASVLLSHQRFLPVHDGVQCHALLREGVVGQQSLVGEEVEYVFGVEILDQFLESALFKLQLPEFVFVIPVFCWILLLFPDDVIQALDPAFEGRALLEFRLEAADDLVGQPTVVIPPSDEVIQVRQCLRTQPPGEETDKAREQRLSVRLDEFQQHRRKCCGACTLQVVEYRSEVLRESASRDACGHPAVKAIGQELTFKDCRGVEEHTGHVHVAGQHAQRIGEEILIMGPDVGDGQIEPIAVPAACPADSLEVVGLGWRDRTLDGGGEVTDVDAHFHCRGARQKVGVPRLAILRFSFERVLYALTFLTVQ